MTGSQGDRARGHAEAPELIADGGFIPTLDHTFPPDISYENFVYYTGDEATAGEDA